MGKRIYPNGRIEEGHFFDGELFNRGKVIYPDGRIEEGTFIAGKLRVVPWGSDFLKFLLGMGKVIIEVTTGRKADLE